MVKKMDQIRWGVIGCGDVVRKRVARAILDEPRSRLVAACRRNPSELEKFCRDFGVPKAYGCSQSLMEDAEIDAVYIATPVGEHLEQTVSAARSGKHVLVEKPMAMCVDECDKMIRVCESAKVKLGVAYYRRFYPMVRRMEQLLEDGVLGKPLAVSAVTATPLSIMPDSDLPWRVRRESGGGGALMDIGSHRLNLFLHLFGNVSRVHAVCETVAADYEVEDTALLLLRFQSGMTGTLQCHFGCDDPDEFAILGTRGRVIARPLNGKELIIVSDGKVQTEVHMPPSNLCGPLVEDFVSAILEERQPKVSGEEGRETNAVMSLSYQAAIEHPDSFPRTSSDHHR